jgi:uncharacterized protein (TIGR02246 family)
LHEIGQRIAVRWCRTARNCGRTINYYKGDIVNILKTAAVIAVGLVALAGCKPASYDSTGDSAAVGELNKSWATAYNAGDADGVANLYTDDATVTPPGVAALVGRDAIRNFIASDSAAAKAAGMTMNIASTDLGVTPDLAYDTGTFTVTDASGATVDSGSYVSVVKKKDGKWFLYRDIWNSDRAPAAAAAPASEPAA